MSKVELAAAVGRSLVRADLAFETGVCTVVALTPDGAGELVELVSGISRPRAGTVRIDGKDPYATPAVRRSIGSLLSVEEPMESRTVEAGVARALLLRESPKRAVDVLDALGLAALAKRAPESLSAGEARGVALALALGASPGGVLALYEPLSTPAGRAGVAESIAEAARDGASVLCVTASPRDAGDLGGRTFPLRFGRVGGETRLGGLGAPSDSGPAFVVRTDEPRRLAATLCADPAVAGLSCDLTSPGEVVVSGSDSNQTSLAILRGARDSGAQILGLWQRKLGHAGSRMGGASW